LNILSHQLFNEGAKIILDDILLSIQYKSIPKPVLIVGVNNQSINTVVKTTAKNLLCKNEICDHSIKCNVCSRIESEIYPDFHIIDNELENNIKSEEIQESVITKSYTTSTNNNGKVFSILNAHTMTSQAMNNLLKLFEEPFPGNVYVLGTNNINKIPKTILSRCEIFTIPSLSYENFINICTKKFYIDDIKFLNEIWFFTRGEILLSELLLNDSIKFEEYKSEVKQFFKFISYPVYKKIELSDYYLDVFKNNFSKFLYILEITKYIIRDLIIYRQTNRADNNLLTFYLKILADKDDSKCIDIIKTLDEVSNYYYKNVNTTLVIDNLIYSL
tara:strand:- start:884 stop:1876 length:993 start_codon:yes stop_codon:yes gene_type:complete